LRRKGLLLDRALGEVGKEETKEFYEYFAHRILRSITEKDLEQASLRDKMTASAIATDKALLLSGQPTQILSIPELEGLDKLTKVLLAEAGRRGIEAVANPVTQEVHMEALPPGRGERGDPMRGVRGPNDEPR